MPISPALLIPAMSSAVRTTGLRDETNIIIRDENSLPILED